MHSINIFSKTIFLLWLSLSLTNHSVAETFGYSGSGYFSSGIIILDLQDLNAALADKGFPEFNSEFPIFGSAGEGCLDRFLIGGEGYYIPEYKKISGEYSVNLSGGLGFLNVGYKFPLHSGISLYPLIGIGGGGINLSIFRNDVSESFDDLLGSPEQGVVLQSGGFLVSVALGINYPLRIFSEYQDSHGIIIGFRAGYTIPLYSDNWLINDKQISGGPASGVGGFRFTLLIGGGR